MFAGIGGTAMAERGLVSLFPLEELAINGFAAIPARLPRILRRIREAAAAAIAALPDALVIIDSPDFTHRVARRVRARDPSIPIVDFPGMRSIRIDSACSARHKSSVSPVMRVYLIPASGLNSNVVTTGPGLICVTRP